MKGRTIFFLRAASAFFSALASFAAVSFSSFVCASRLSVPSLACSASANQVEDTDRGSEHLLTFGIELIVNIGVLFQQRFFAFREAGPKLAIFQWESAD